MSASTAAAQGDEYAIVPNAQGASVDTSSWPLLLKNYDQREYFKHRETQNWKHEHFADYALSSCRSYRSLYTYPSWMYTIEA